MMALFRAAVAAGMTYWPASSLTLDPLILAAWKGAGVGLLAFWAAMRARWWLAAILGFGALGDVLIEVAGLEIGASAFLVGHLCAIGLYARHRVRRAAGLYLLVPVVAVAALWLAGGWSAGLALYSTVLGAMAVGAMLSRYRIAAIGAWLFVASDLLIFARLGVLAGSWLPDLLVWPLYFAGQALIAWDIGRVRDEGVHDRI